MAVALLALTPLTAAGPAGPLAPPAKLATSQPDADRDGIPDLVELILGMDPKQRDSLHLVYHDKTIAEGDSVSRMRKNVPDVTDVYAGNAAGNRWVWRIDFADRFEGAGANLLLYIDADNDPKTGRRHGAPGTDVRLMYYTGGFVTVLQNTRVLGRDRSLRGMVTDRSLYFSMDLNLHTDASGLSRYRAHVLCQMAADPADSDATGFFPIVGPGMRDLAKRPVGVLSQALSDGALVQKPWLGWRDDLRALRPVTLQHGDAKVQGMKTFNRALEPVAEKATAAWRSPVAGAYHVNVLVQDSGVGREQVLVRVGGKSVARFVAGQNDGDLYLFTADRATSIEQGTEIVLEAAAPAQDFRLCEAFLTPKPLRPGPLAVTHLATHCSAATGVEVDVDVCFLTNASCQASVRWGTPGKLDNHAGEDEETYNHRIRLRGLARGQAYAVQAIASDGDAEVRTDVLRFVADRKRLSRGSAQRKRVALSVGDMMQGKRPAWPVGGGVPIPQGELASARKCRLLNATGEAEPAGFRELAWWPDGSVKWLLVTVLHRPGTNGYTLEYGQQVAPPRPPADGVRVSQTADGLRVVTDVLKVELSRKKGALPGAVWLDRDRNGTFADDELIVSPDGDGLVLVDGDGSRYASAFAAPKRLVVEEEDPVRTVVLAEGPFAGEKGRKLSYRCRLYFYRGFAGLPITVQLVADEGETIFPPTLHRIKSVTLPLRLAGDAVGTKGQWVQDDDDHYVAHVDGRSTEHQGHAAAVKAVRAGGTSVAVAIRDFWQLYPKGLSFDGRTLTAEIFPELPSKQYAEHTDPKLLTMRYYWFRDGAYLVPCGTAPSTDLLLAFGDGNPEVIEKAWQAPVLLTASPTHYCASGALLDLEPERPGVFERFKAFVRDGFEKVEERRRRGRWFGWMDYGDWYGERSVNWGNQEYDMQWGLLVEFARSGEMRFFHRAETAARHTACIDQITWSPTAQHLGIQKEHALWHVGGFNTPRVEGAKFWFDNGIYNTGHMWSLGTYAAYWLTGDRRFKDAMDLLSEWMTGQYCRQLEQWLHRNYGWSTLVVLGAYYTDPHPTYLNAARLFMHNVVSKRDPGAGAFIHPIGECTHTPRHMGGKTFMSGVVISAMRLMDRLEPSDDYKAAILDTCDWMFARMWHPDRHGFRYAQCPQFDNVAGSWGVTMPCDALAYAYELTKKREYYDMLIQPLADLVRPDGGSASAKGYAMQIRMTPFAFSAMERWGMKELPPLPPKAPRVTMADWLYVAEGQPARLTVLVDGGGHGALEATLEIVELPAGLTADRRRVTWATGAGVTCSPPMAIAGSAREGEAVRLRYTLGQWTGTLAAKVRRAAPLDLGSHVGYVGGKEDPVGLALRALGVELEPLADLRPETLAGYRALLVGSEAHEKGFAGLPAEAQRLVDFAHAGGRVAVMQMQDSSFRAGYLPYPLAIANDKGALAKITVPEHPIFRTPHRINSLAGLVSYDTIPGADAAWRVLATDAKGAPSIVEAAFGKGRVLLVQPSPDRYVLGREEARPPLTVKACSDFLRNIVAYLSATP